MAPDESDRIDRLEKKVARIDRKLNALVKEKRNGSYSRKFDWHTVAGVMGGIGVCVTPVVVALLERS